MYEKAQRVVLVLIDGARADVFYEMLGRGDLPNLARHVVEPGGTSIGTSVFPSTTGVAYIPFLYGQFPGTLGIPGIRWLDREGSARGFAAKWRAARSYCGVQGPWFDRDTAPASTIFDNVPSLAICSPITRGLAAGAHRIPVQRAMLGALAHYAGTYLWLDRAVTRAWLAAADEPDWRFLFVVYPGPDGITHLEDPFHASVLQSYREIDAALGAFLARAAKRGEKPAIMVTADHGATAMPAHCDIAIQLEAWGVPTLRHPVHVWRRAARAAVMVSGNASAQVYFEPHSGRAGPLAFDAMPEDLVSRLVELDAVRLAACRDGDGGVLVLSREGRARLRESGPTVHVDSIDGDPLGLGPASLVLDDRELLTRSRSTDVPDAPRQLLQLFRTDRAGDLVLAAREGFDFRGPWELPEHRAGHGSLIADHMNVPILSSRPLPEAPVRTVDLMPAILEWLGAAVPAGTLDGIPFSAVEDASASR
jgi:hypothetical protein